MNDTLNGVTTQPQEQALPRSKVLVVEDELNLLEGVRNILELENYDVLTAENGVQALEVLRAQALPPDLILSDIMMPGMSGLQLLQEVRKERRWLTIPFIFLTARGEKVDVLKAKELGVDDYITKPYDPTDLLIIVKSRLDRYREMNSLHDGTVNTLKRNILTILNHEFRTPLTFIVAYADMLNQFVADNLTDEELRAYLQGVSTGADRLRRLIENFILLVELETGEARETFGWRRQPIASLTEVILLARDEVVSREDMAGAECVLAVSPDLPTFTGDREYLQRALVQLIDNAFKFSPPASTVTVGAETADGNIRIWVKDTGRGIPLEEQAHILNSFYQINRTFYEDQGAGAGLAIAKGVAALHNGRLEIESVVDEGSTFTLVIPVA
jgi:two-component system sensor histidine kinase/response regulator